jgi:hypothetical protein
MKNKNSTVSGPKLFDVTNKSKAIKDMVGTADDLKNVGMDVDSVEVNNNWDGNLYTYTLGRFTR